ncbi:MAG: transglutaminase-like domain-containing protein [Candidatus Thermoplasmatota archaeon]|nr:transglutaminase-like domain-containing protein [Candidatus Thermoplasmatota archaeon]
MVEDMSISSKTDIKIKTLLGVLGIVSILFMSSVFAQYGLSINGFSGIGNDALSDSFAFERGVLEKYFSSSHHDCGNNPADYIRPNEWLVQHIVEKHCKYPLKENMVSNCRLLYEWVCHNIEYKSDSEVWDVRDYWQLPSTTILKRTGDCEDQAILLTSLLRAAEIPRDNVQLVYGILKKFSGKEYGHAWVEIKPIFTSVHNLVADSEIARIKIEFQNSEGVILHSNSDTIIMNATSSLDAAEDIQVEPQYIGRRERFIPLDTCVTLPFGKPIPFSWWITLGYTVYWPSKAIPERFYVDMAAVQLLTNKSIFTPRENVTITFENIGRKNIYILKENPWWIEKRESNQWIRIYPMNIIPINSGEYLCSFTIKLKPGETKEWHWNQKDYHGNQVETGIYRVRVSYKAEKYVEVAYFNFIISKLVPIPEPIPIPCPRHPSMPIIEPPLIEAPEPSIIKIPEPIVKPIKMPKIIPLEKTNTLPS